MALFLNYASFAQAEIENMSENIRFGLRHSFSNGTSPFLFRSCYGYKNEGNRLIIDIAKAKIVELIFSLRLSGYSVSQIKETLEKDKVQAPNGGRMWSKHTIYSILRNEKYIGDVLLGKTYVKNLFDGKQCLNSGQRDRFLVISYHPAIIKRDVFLKLNPEYGKLLKEE